MSHRPTSHTGRAQVALAAALLLPTLAPPARSAIRSGAWTGDFSIPSLDGTARTCAIYQGQYYVAGAFDWAGGVRARNVAWWNGERWEQAGAGLLPYVNRLLPWGAELLAATSSYGSSVSPVMRFDGYTWRPLGPTLYGTAEALLVQGADLYIAGSLFQVGMENSYRVMRWDGTAWQPVGGSFDNRIVALGIYQGELYAGGEFLNAEDQFVSRIARWDGAHWQPVGGGTNAGGGVAVNAFAVYGGRLIAGGYFSEMGSVPARGVAAWNGIEWAALPETPNDCLVTDLLVEGSVLHVTGVLQVPNLWAAGLVTFDGQAWRPPSPYPDWGIQDVAAEGGAMIAVGNPTGVHYGAPSYSFVPARGVVVRDPTWRPLFGWSPTMRGLLGPGQTDVMALHTHKGELYAGGYFWHAATPSGWMSTQGLARWKDGAWEAVGGDQLIGWVQAIGSYGERLVVGGGGFTAGQAHSSVLTWDGREWSDLGSLLEGGVVGVAEWQGALVAAGGLRLFGQQSWSAVAIHRGSQWEILGEPLIHDQTAVSTVAVFRGELFVGGGSLSATAGSGGLMRWEGSRWAPVPGAPQGAVRCLLPRADGLWVGLYRYNLLNDSAVWRWDGMTWTEMGSLAGDTHVLAEVGGDVFVGGALFAPTFQAGVARWTGDQWTAVTDGPSSGVEALAVSGNDLFVGGWFRSLGKAQAEGIARWSFTTDSPAPGPAPAPFSISTWPSPARDRLSFRLTLPREGRVSITIHNLAGARVATLLDEVLPAGYSERSWTIQTNRVPAGVYFARAEGPGVSWSGKVVIVH